MKLNFSTRAAGTNWKIKASPLCDASVLNRQRLGLALAPVNSRSARGITLPEVMVALGVGSIVLMVIAMVFMNTARSFAAMGNYVSMDSDSRTALDHMTREIRQAGDLLEFSPTRLKFARYGIANSFLIYNWDAASRQLTEWKTGDADARVLLSECDQLAFSMYNAAFAPTATLSQSKGVSVTWQCTRTVLGNKTTSEDMQQALIVMRNKPL